MSRFLAPIHNWLFNKIKLHEELERNLINVFTAKYGEDIEKISSNMQDKYGAPTEDSPLEDIIDTSNIHGWLQQRISAAETRLAAILTEVFNKHGKIAEDIAVSQYSEHGAKYGLDAKSSYRTDTAPQIYDALNSYILEGMPCDNVNSITARSDEQLEWNTTRCLHRGYWEQVGANIDTLYKLRYNWTKAFVENANDKFEYTVIKQHFNGEPGFVNKIKIK